MTCGSGAAAFTPDTPRGSVSDLFGEFSPRPVIRSWIGEVTVPALDESTCVPRVTLETLFLEGRDADHARLFRSGELASFFVPMYGSSVNLTPIFGEFGCFGHREVSIDFGSVTARGDNKILTSDSSANVFLSAPAVDG